MQQSSGKTKVGPVLALATVIVLAAATALWAQQQQQQVPDAPSASRPPQTSPFPAGTKPAPANPTRPESTSSSSSSNQDDNSANGTAGQSEANNNSAPRASSTPGLPRRTPRNPDDDGRDQFTIPVSVNFVTVPVTVKDSDGHLVEGLLRKDFSIYEDGNAEMIKLFTSDPFPLSAALIIDQGMPDSALKKVNQSLPAITGAFSQFDEVALYTYGDTVQKAADFQAAGDQLTGALRKAKRRGATGGVPVTSGPLASGPTVNNRPFDPSTPQVRTPEKETHALNDAVLRAAMDLSKREKARRKIIFIISDGKEEGSRASYADVLKVLLSHEIGVYAIGVDSAAIPGYDKLSKVHLPFTAYGNILPKYVSATGGEYFSEFTAKAIEGTYSRVTEVARNQYTLGYTTRATAASNYRTVEVRVKRPGLRVFAKDGYYPLPPQRANP